jgi:hypothetical protein
LSVDSSIFTLYPDGTESRTAYDVMGRSEWTLGGQGEQRERFALDAAQTQIEVRSNEFPL